ncbi:DegQ family serine endoprotease [Pelomonas sp. SE-A7]|uniref:DegQ family serine endoprotease n=1 Tax=Pelomonas sp. SE-A7 TaxID=3054953 RepID=UPI00259CE4C8|nr:DegQ family serine endoprotease [Pelomonas sp. SE-A7]MDM4765179.1 DegQ family serine endoprotease [Pelomonas sp. SE-A7]
MNTERTISAKRLVWALATAGVLGAATGALAMKGSAAAMAPAHEQAALLASAAATATAAAPPTSAAAPTTLALPDFASIAARQGGAVVNISVTGSTKQANGALQRRVPIDEDDPLFEYFRRFQIPGQPGQREMPLRGQGSGFIVSADGIILTNAHVVRDAKDVTVKLTDRREFTARVLGADPKTDVAVLKIEARNLPVVQLGATKDLRVGEWVLAIGSPFGFENSVSAGVVSAKGRALPQESFVPFIQTDVAINPGNSGGPLFNARGEVVGINSQIYSQSGGYQGLSFAIPIEVANRVRQQIEKGGKAQHARLGLVIQDVNQGFADSFKLDRPEGALVASVEEGGPGARAGLRSGDVILALDGKPIVASSDLPAMLGLATPGESVKLEVWRQGRRETISAKLGDASDKPALAAEADDQASPGQPKLGLALRPLQPEERRESGARDGLLVQDVTGPAASAGVRPGDVLLAINGTPVGSVEQVRKVVGEAGRSVALLVQRGRDKIFLPVKLG